MLASLRFSEALEMPNVKSISADAEMDVGAPSKTVSKNPPETVEPEVMLT